MGRLQPWLALAIAPSVMVLAASAGAATEDPDCDIAGGHYFAQTNGQPLGASATGYAITNAVP